jgi:hypothetical protein
MHFIIELMNKTTANKKLYQSPEIVSVEIDSEITLTLNSFDDPFEPGMNISSYNNESNQISVLIG